MDGDAQRLYGRTVAAGDFSDEGLRREQDRPAPAPAAAGEPGLPFFEARSATRRLERDGGGNDGMRFRAESLLGVGATGEVYSVSDRNLERMVAVKVLLGDLRGNRDDVDGFVREARITAALAHPNVMPVHDFDLTADGRPYIAMGRIKGRSLGAMLAESAPGAPHPALPSRNAMVSMAIAVCNAAAFAHHQGIVHQDIKPDNIMLGDFGEVLLVDWGSAGRVDASGRVIGQIYGTPLYMSPEQARREGADARSDVYGIGATLFHALTLRLPTWSDQPERFWEMKRIGEIDPPTVEERRGLPPELLAIALKAMAADPAARYATAEAMRGDLEQYQAGLAVSAHRDSLARRLRRWYRANAKLFWTVAVSASAVALSLGMLALERAKESRAWVEVQGDLLPADPEALARAWHTRVHLGWDANVPFVDAATAPPLVTPSDGGMLITGDERICDVALAQRTRGDVALEWDYRPLRQSGNLNCFIGGPDRYDSFTFHVGVGGATDRCIISRQNETLMSVPMPMRLELGRTYRFRIEREDGHVLLTIDGSTILDWNDAEDVCGASPTVGFDGVLSQSLWIGHVRLFRRTAGRRVSPLELGDDLYALRFGDPAADAKALAEAERHYREVADDYLGSDIGVRAEFRLCLCAARRHDAGAADAFLSFAKAHPDHELEPFALLQASRLLANAAARAPIRELLTRHRGQALLQVELRRIGDEQFNLVHGRQGAALRDAARSAEDTLVSWGKRFGCDPHGLQVARDIDHELIVDGQDLVALELPLTPPEDLGFVMRARGRHSEVLQRCRDVPTVVCDTLREMGRYQEAVAIDGAYVDARVFALFRLGDFAGMRRLAPHHQLFDRMDLYKGHIEEYLARHPKDEFGPDFGRTPRVLGLWALGRFQQLYDEYRNPEVRGTALVRLGRIDEALAGFGTVESVRESAAIALDARGEWERALAVLEPGERAADIAHTALRSAAIAAEHGDPARARAELERVLAVDHETLAQRPWNTAAFALGRIDEAAFLAQPFRECVEQRLLSARALRRQLAGDERGAAELYLQVMELPFWQRDLNAEEIDWMEWRIRAAGLEPPPGPAVPSITTALL
jgi:hypothetical protein